MQDRFVIAIGRQLGSGGKAVGEAIARRLGIRLYDRQLINLAAEESGFCTEFFERADEKEARRGLSTLIGYLRSPFMDGDSAANNVLSNDALFKIQSDVIRDVAARESCIFVGRCADYILRDDPRCVSVFVTADRADRIERLCRAHGIAPAEAESRMERTDRCRADYYNYYSSRTWGEAATYDLCVNSSVLGVERTAELVLEFAAGKLHTKF
ncbi:MAG: cytidylate kinase-like family protein [Alistipes sp.]|nr:cytidylate kinase-like family protein [Alistipes sp.]